MHENKFHDRSAFVTLTYNDEHLPSGASLVKADAQNFFKRLRKFRKVRFFLAGEYGEVGRRPHYHAIIFGVNDLPEDIHVLEKAWSLDGKAIGFVDVKKVEYASCAYVARYVVKKQVGQEGAADYARRGVIPEFTLMSRRPGIGGNFIAKYKEEVFNRGFMVVCGHKAAIPKYYVSKIYDTPEREAVRSVQLQAFHADNLKKRLDRKKELGYASIAEIDRLDAEGTKKVLDGRLSLRRKKL